jgi:hypothetical protein
MRSVAAVTMAAVTMAAVSVSMSVRHPGMKAQLGRLAKGAPDL